jgi:hypothetical protein
MAKYYHSSLEERWDSRHWPAAFVQRFKRMREDKTIRGKRYRVIVEPVGRASQTRTKLAVCNLDDLTQIYERVASLGETTEALLQKGWGIAENDAGRTV